MQSLTKNKDMQSALQRLRALTALEVRALASETRADTAEALTLSSNLLDEIQAMKFGKNDSYSDYANLISYSAQTHDTLSLQILERSIALLAESQSE